MKHRPPAPQGSHTFDADSAGDDEEFPPTRFFTDAFAQNTTSPAKHKRTVKILTIAGGLGLGLVAVLGLAALLML